MCCRKKQWWWGRMNVFWQKHCAYTVRKLHSLLCGTRLKNVKNTDVTLPGNATLWFWTTTLTVTKKQQQKKQYDKAIMPGKLNGKIPVAHSNIHPSTAGALKRQQRLWSTLQDVTQWLWCCTLMLSFLQQSRQKWSILIAKPNSGIMYEVNNLFLLVIYQVEKWFA